MKLYTFPFAPNPTKVMLYIAEREEAGTKMDIEQVLVSPIEGEQNQPEHLARNPFGALPTLELEDGSYIRESLAIIQYLDEKYPEQAMISGSVEERGILRDVERITDLRLANPMAGWIHATKSPLGLAPNPSRAKELNVTMTKGLTFIEQLLKDGRPLINGDEVSVADCTLAAALQFSRFAELDVLEDYPNIRAWDSRYQERPAAKAVLQL